MALKLFLSQGVGNGGEMTSCFSVVSKAEAELQREVEELKLRLHMAAEHYKEKYRECQRLRRQVAKLNTPESQAVSPTPKPWRHYILWLQLYIIHFWWYIS